MEYQWIGLKFFLFSDFPAVRISNRYLIRDSTNLDVSIEKLQMPHLHAGAESPLGAQSILRELNRCLRAAHF